MSDFRVERPSPPPALRTSLRTLSVKYLRDERAPGQKTQAAVKRTLRPGTHLRIVEVDLAGVDDHINNRYPVIWAKVEVLAE